MAPGAAAGRPDDALVARRGVDTGDEQHERAEGDGFESVI
jgi:hypothetical protein